MEFCIKKRVDGEIDKATILKAEKLSKYFIVMAKRMKIEKSEADQIKDVLSGKKTTKEKIIELYKENPNFNRSKAAEVLGVTRMTIIRIIKSLEDEV